MNKEIWGSLVVGILLFVCGYFANDYQYKGWVELHKTPSGIFYFENNKKGEKIIYTASELRSEEQKVGSYK